MSTELSQPGQRGAYIDALFAAGAVGVAPDADHLTELRNGQLSWVYVDHGKALGQPETRTPYLNLLHTNVTARYTDPVLINVDSKSSAQTVGALADRLQCRMIAVNPEQTSIAEKGSGLRVRYPRELSPNDNFIIVDDVFTVGDVTAIRVAEMVRQGLAERFAGKTLQRKFELIVGVLRGSPEVARVQLEHAGIGALHWSLTIEEVGARALSALALTTAQREGLSAELAGN